MPEYIVHEVTIRKENIEGKYGTKKSLNLKLGEYGQTPVIAEWYTNQETPLPEKGSKLNGTIEQDPQFGFKFKKAQPEGGGRGGGGGWKPRPPEERRSIAIQHAQKCAVTILEVAAQHGDYTPPNAGDVVKQVKTVAAALFAQCLDAEDGKLGTANEEGNPA